MEHNISRNLFLMLILFFICSGSLYGEVIKFKNENSTSFKIKKINTILINIKSNEVVIFNTKFKIAFENNFLKYSEKYGINVILGIIKNPNIKNINDTYKLIMNTQDLTIINLEGEYFNKIDNDIDILFTISQKQVNNKYEILYKSKLNTNRLPFFDEEDIDEYSKELSLFILDILERNSFLELKK